MGEVRFRGSVTLAGATAPAWADVEVAEDAVIAVADGAAHRIAWDDLAVDSGGFEGDVVFCRSKSRAITISVTNDRFVAALRAASKGRLDPAITQAARKTTKRRLGRRVSAGCLLLVLAGIGVAFWKAPALLALSVDALPTSVDRDLGDGAFADMRLSTVDDPVLETFLAETVARLQPHARPRGFDFRAEAVADEEVNAFALPGGQMVVLTGLLTKASSPDQVAGVMAHEMSHVTLRHGMRNVAHQAGTMLAVQLLLGDGSAWAQLGAGAAVIAQQNDYSRDQENEADAEGTRMLCAAGLDPEGLVGFFELLRGIPGSEMPGGLGWLSTHPRHEERIEHIREVAAELGCPRNRPLAVDWAAIQTAARAAPP